MFGITNLPTFIAAGILLNLTPGADTMYILGRSIAQGRKAGIYSAMGIVTGIFVHISFAALGLSMIIAKSAAAFNLVKYGGALYLTYLGVQMVCKKPVNSSPLEIREGKSLRKLYIAGILTNVLNPKVALFFLVFLPQFIVAPEAHNPLPFFILGFIFLIPGTIWCIILAIFSSLLSQKIRSKPSMGAWINRVAGVLFIGLGLRLTFMSRK